MANLIERHRDRIEGVLSCFDHVMIQGTLPSVGYAKAMSIMLDGRGIRLFDYATELPSHSVRPLAAKPNVCPLPREYFIHGFRNRSLREHLAGFRSTQISRKYRKSCFGSGTNSTHLALLGT